jgi:valyl-tRNA synthetase
MVEKRIRETDKLTRHDLGRDELVRRIWAWKDQYEAQNSWPTSLAGCVV